MIRYSLRCKDGHGFESWFQSADAFDTLSARGLVSCATCGSTEVEKALMAPKVQAKPLSAPVTEVERKIAALRAKVEAEATYVGNRFAEEARAIHETGGDKPIWGEANATEAKALIEDGIPVAPLPFLPKQKAN
ncbi:DUF1178 family protein [Jannaschia sp. M317]|uniref:DUF1178 family protein n=1 Tax=Jannaschia sp. M317 TaxID=2867011 RepID=UPI0021A2F441|nr:DUF1178 family protein [Jannaschia sp. M317]UWQ16451.1 DUF1178 family protein [Jannaschia sp. M317]